MRVYVIGTEGQVARSLREAATNRPDVVIGCAGRPDVDILRGDLVERALLAFSPDVVINPAAYTAVDRAESEPDLAFAVNRDGAGIVAATAAKLGIPIIHLSTDYVFDGKKQSPYVETDAVAPNSVYGRSKLAGEHEVARANHRHVILRTSWIYAPFGNNFVRTMLRLSDVRDRLTVVDDQIGCPTFAPDIANAIIAISRKIESIGWQQQLAGVTHLAGPDEITWCGFARLIMQGKQKRGGRFVPVDAISTADYPTAAARPANSRLGCERLATVFDFHMPPLERSLDNCMDRLLGANH
ncbi:dTDP-4-dehydrorhamnose reductase [Bradyrhizobium sp. sBnM-33]|uniref:dTDP-4-dehydrorhamnose reductase n=1 Tax=Bradyrhizobium sp. sBnM-33 TaxID=2831780 RepID=UPI001BCF79D6|nr:dTDP-4-dehydrorhamnose reductase [Bradyrhizobium sp. sBnM-33]WOH53691.1 dTDP-4-dehydrorhamnose reductase [Bradyrhizobium sp. sBnM-33]